MLWLMSRIAWRGRQLEQRGNRLLRWRVAEIIEQELHLDERERPAKLVEVGVLLTLQANVSDGDGTILFGHQSFREFLVARFWRDTLRRIIESDRGSQREAESNLLGARLLQDEDRSIDFLVELLDEWPDDDRRRLVEWAESCFNDETPDVPAGERPSEDRRPFLREAALAIGSLVRDGGVRARHERALRSLLGWFWTWRSDSPTIWAPRLVSPRANLSNSVWVGGYLAEGALSQANFELAHVYESNFDGAVLSGANFSGARLFDMGLAGADLSQADLSSTSFDHANLAGANLALASVDDADFERTNLRGANLRGASLFSARFHKADWSGADLADAALHDADLSKATLTDIRLTGARFTSSTRWPEGFDPVAAGAILEEEAKRSAASEGDLDGSETGGVAEW